jgi:hypothetical protein
MGATWLLLYVIYLCSFTEWPNEGSERKKMAGLPENETDDSNTIRRYLSASVK